MSAPSRLKSPTPTPTSPSAIASPTVSRWRHLSSYSPRFSSKAKSSSATSASNDSADVRSDPNDSVVWYMPRFEVVASSFPLDFGLRRLDHTVVNVPDLAVVVGYVKSFTGFHEFSEFTTDYLGTDESGIHSAVLACNDENMLFPMRFEIRERKMEEGESNGDAD